MPVTGAGPSILRAGVMGMAAVVAAFAGRPASRWYALLLAAALTLGWDPRAWQDVGWQLSFAAVAGIFVLVRPIAGAMRALPEPLRMGAALTVAATLATAPLMAFHFERVSLAALPANLAALPAIPLVMWTGMLSAAAAQVWIVPAELLNALNGFFLAYVAAVARWGARLPGAVAEVGIDGPVRLAIAYAVLAGILGAAWRLRAAASAASRSASARARSSPWRLPRCCCAATHPHHPRASPSRSSTSARGTPPWSRRRAGSRRSWTAAHRRPTWRRSCVPAASRASTWWCSRTPRRTTRVVSRP